ncbi:hypothetical protein [Fodinibius sp. Rm-B-1B1-1]|uniref:tetratricopeptide repeat protein n=1 Tax=Fodinibius alkaliphilus TaxID=3140241 RepID=UPI00315A6EDA
MESGLESISHESQRNADWITGVLFLSERSYYDHKKVTQWNNYFGSLIVAGMGTAPEYLPEAVDWFSCDPEMGKAQVWNAIAREHSGQWMLFAEDDEQIHFSDMPGQQAIENNQWVPALITIEKEGTQLQYYQMRLVNTSEADVSDVFSGFNLPDATDYVRSNGIILTDKPIVIERETKPHLDIKIDAELSQQNQSPKLYLVQGKRDLNDNKYVRAAAQFRQLLKKEKLLPFDRLAAVNGLASCLAEQHKWENALSLTKQSLEAESLQCLPYLIQFRIHELRKEWHDALNTLQRYYDRFSLFSRANFDRKIDEEKTLINLANVALKAGQRSKATDYFDKLFSFKRGAADRRMLEKALLLSIELEDYERAVYLFERMYGDQLPPNEMEEQIREEIDEVMTLFMKRDWYDYVSNVYKKLHNAHPRDQEYKRKLIVTLTKTNRLDQAKKMVANIV